jgi:hypothetical protein
MVVLFLLLIGLCLALITVSIVFWTRMLVDCVSREFEHPDDKLIWVLILIFVNAFGAVIYYFMVKKKARP